MEIAILFTLVLLNGVFAMSEIALVTSRKARLQLRVEEGDLGAAAAIELGQEPTKFMSTVQIGITSIGILNGIVGEAVLAQPLAIWLLGLGMDAKVADYASTGLVVVVITYFTIVLGELVPKRLGQMYPEAIARVVSRPIMWLSLASKPFVKLLGGSTSLVLKLLGVKEKSGSSVTQEEIHALLVEGSDAGVIEQHEHTMVRNVFRLDDRQIGSLMVPRSDIVALDATLPWSENLKRIDGAEHSRFPVVQNGLQNILGIATAKSLLTKTLKGETPNIAANLKAPVYVPDSLTGMELLENFRQSGVQIAFVVDEYGEVLGMVTLKDVMEAITGEFKPSNVENAWAIQREDGSWLLDGLIPVPELKDRLSLKAVPEEERKQYHTLSGMMMVILGRMPKTADSVIWEGWRLEIVDLDGKRIDKVLATQVAAK